MNKICLAIIEDIEDIREYYEDYFSKQEEFSGVYAYESMELFFESLNEDRLPDVILSDINLPGIDGIEGIKKIKSKYPDIDIIMLTVLNNSDKIFKSICAGATGYAMKDTLLPDLKRAVLDVHSGGSYMSPSIARKILEYFAPPQKIADPLTTKEKQIVQGLVDGLSYKMIADRIYLSHDTVRFYVKKIYRKLEINTKIELIGKYHKGEL
jgi:DNA-binding NarL/FixJ family response regulator